MLGELFLVCYIIIGLIIGTGVYIDNLPLINKTKQYRVTLLITMYLVLVFGWITLLNHREGYE